MGFRHLFLLGIALLTISFNGYGQSYTIEQATGVDFETLNAPTSVFPADDQTVGPYNLGFDFVYFGTTYSQIYISSNGFLSFENTSNGCCSGQFIPNTGQPNNMIAAFYEDFDPPEGGSVRYQTVGNAGSRIFVLEFNGVYPWNGPPKIPSTWQIKLFECSNRIEIHCLSCVSDGGQVTQGLENAAGTEAYVVGGRNSTNFSVSDDVVSFIPAGSTPISPLDLADRTVSVDESDNVGREIIDLDAVDPDNASLEYSIIDGNDLNLFSINSTTGVITQNAVLDYESLSGSGDETITLVINVEDNAISCRNAQAEVDITVQNVEEDPYTIGNTNLTNLSTDDNFAQSFRTTDEGELLYVDLNFNTSPGTILLEVFEGSSVNSGDQIYSEQFSGIGTGVVSLSLSSSLEIDEDQSYTFQVSSGSNFSIWYQNSDVYVLGNAFFNGIAQPTRDLYFTVGIGSFNASPVLEEIDDISVQENNNPSEELLFAEANDPDNDNLTYSLAGGGGYFTINPSTGALMTNGSLDYEQIFAATTVNPIQYTLTVTVTDDGLPSKSAQTSFVVTIENAEDTPYEIGNASSNISLNGNTSIGQSFTTTDAGYLTEFDINVINPPSSGEVTLQFWEDSDLNPTSGGTGPGHVETNLVYETTVEITTTGVQTIELPQPMMVEAMTVYSMEMFGTNLNLHYRSSNLYRRGRILWSNQLYGCCDLYFVARVEPFAEKISLVSPSNGFNIENNAQFVNFVWDASEEMVSESVFYVVISTAGEEVFISDPIVGATSYQLALSQLSRDKIYRWQVVTLDEQESQEALFKTPSLITSNKESLIASLSAYPNPFNSDINFDISLKKESKILIVLYDLRGKEMVSKRMDLISQNHKVKLSPADLKTGLYLFKVFAINNAGAEVNEVYQGKLIKD